MPRRRRPRDRSGGSGHAAQDRAGLPLALALLGLVAMRCRIAGPAATQSLTTVYRSAASGVVRIDATGAAAIEVTDGGQTSGGRSWGDPNSDRALIRTASALHGHTSPLAGSLRFTPEGGQ